MSLEAELQRVINSLEQLKQSYRSQASELPRQHIGVYIDEIADKLHVGSLEYYDRNLDVRLLVRSTLKLVLDQFQDPASLDALNEAGLTPLHIAAAQWCATDCVELLLARGADPDKSSGGTTACRALFNHEGKARAGKNADYLFELVGLFYLRDFIQFLKSSPESEENAEYISIAWQTGDWHHIKRATADIQLGKMLSIGPWGSRKPARRELGVWIHLPFTNVSLGLNLLSL